MADDKAEPEPGGDPAGDPADAAGLVNELRRLRRNARSARHAYWFPLVLFGLLTVAAIPFYAAPGPSVGITVRPLPLLPVLGGLPATTIQDYLGYYWLVALLGGLALTLGWYRRHARRIGLKTPARAYLITVTALTGLALILPLLARLGPFRFLDLAMPADLIVRGTFPFLIIAIGLCVLAWAERSWALGVIAVVYTGTALLASLYNVENIVSGLYLPNLTLPAVVLLAAGVGAFVVQRRQRSLA